MNSRFYVHDLGETIYKFDNVCRDETEDIPNPTRSEDNVRFLQSHFETI